MSSEQSLLSTFSAEAELYTLLGMPEVPHDFCEPWWLYKDGICNFCNMPNTWPFAIVPPYCRVRRERLLFVEMLALLERHPEMITARTR